MFADPGDLHDRADSLDLPLQVNTIGQRQFGRLIGAAGVRRIKFHGLRHTVATLMLFGATYASKRTQVQRHKQERC
jgi:integrase